MKRLINSVIGLTGRKDTGNARARDQRGWRWRDLGLNFTGLMSPDAHEVSAPCHLHLIAGPMEAQRGQAAGLKSHSSGGALSNSKSPMLDTLSCSVSHSVQHSRHVWVPMVRLGASHSRVETQSLPLRSLQLVGEAETNQGEQNKHGGMA